MLQPHGSNNIGLVIMFSLISPIRKAFFERSPNASKTLLGWAAPLMLCFGALLSASGCVSSGATAASNNARGVEYFTAGDYDNAIARFQASLEENPESAETYYNLGSAFQRKANATGDLNLLTQAEDAYWTALQMNPAPETIVCCYRGIATSATTRGDASGAMRTLEEWRDRNPDSIEPRLEIAYLLEAQERDDDAYDALQEIAEMAPNDYRAYYKMGVLSERAGDLDSAVEHTSAAAQLTSNSNVALRARTLAAQYAAKEREQGIDGVDSSSAAESALAVETFPAAQTARVQSTSAQAESEPVPELVLPPDEAPQPVETPSADEPAPSASNSLGFGEVVVLSRSTPSGELVQNLPSADASSKRSDTTRFVQSAGASRSSSDDSNVKWISAASTQESNIAQTSANVSQGTSESASAPAQEQKSETPQTTSEEQSARTSDAVAEPVQKAPDNLSKPQKRRTEMGSGFPNMKAGSFF